MKNLKFNRKEAYIHYISASEPDFYKFSYKGFCCIICRHPDFGHLCGYVAVTYLSPAYYRRNCEDDIEVHGGVTYQGKKMPCWGIKGKNNVWFIGFDCAHHGDIIPCSPMRYGTYKTLEFCVNECKGIVNQILKNGGAKNEKN